MPNFDRRGGRNPCHRALPPAGHGKKINTSLMHERPTPCHEQFAEADRREFGVSGDRLNSMCNKYVEECVNGGSCNQRCLIVECWLDLVEDVRAPDSNCDLSLHGVVMLIFAHSDLGMHASFVRDTICTVEAD